MDFPNSVWNNQVFFRNGFHEVKWTIRSEKSQLCLLYNSYLRLCIQASIHKNWPFFRVKYFSGWCTLSWNWFEPDEILSLNNHENLLLKSQGFLTLTNRTLTRWTQVLLQIKKKVISKKKVIFIWWWNLEVCRLNKPSQRLRGNRKNISANKWFYFPIRIYPSNRWLLLILILTNV